MLFIFPLIFHFVFPLKPNIRFLFDHLFVSQPEETKRVRVCITSHRHEKYAFQSISLLPAHHDADTFPAPIRTHSAGTEWRYRHSVPLPFRNHSSPPFSGVSRKIAFARYAATCNASSCASSTPNSSPAYTYSSHSSVSIMSSTSLRQSFLRSSSGAALFCFCMHGTRNPGQTTMHFLKLPEMKEPAPVGFSIHLSCHMPTFICFSGRTLSSESRQSRALSRGN